MIFDKILIWTALVLLSFSVILGCFAACVGLRWLFKHWRTQPAPQDPGYQRLETRFDTIDRPSEDLQTAPKLPYSSAVLSPYYVWKANHNREAMSGLIESVRSRYGVLGTKLSCGSRY